MFRRSKPDNGEDFLTHATGRRSGFQLSQELRELAWQSLCPNFAHPGPVEWLQLAQVKPVELNIQRLPVPLAAFSDYPAKTAVMADGDGGIFLLCPVQHFITCLLCLLWIHVKAKRPGSFGHLGRTMKHVSHDVGRFAAGVDYQAHGTRGVSRRGYDIQFTVELGLTRH